MPAVPAFDLPAAEPGFHGLRELRVHGKPALGTEIKVKGYVTWIYDRPAALASSNPEATRAQILLAIEKDPTLPRAQRVCRPSIVTSIPRSLDLDRDYGVLYGVSSSQGYPDDHTNARILRYSNPREWMVLMTSELVVKNFAHLREVTIPLRDLVVLVGPQASGKSLMLQLFKLILDRTRIVRVLRDQLGFSWDSVAEFASLYFGAGFERSWRESTEIAIGSQVFTLQRASESRARDGEEAVFYVPAHRTLTIAEGWPQLFSRSQRDAPYVARRFAEQLLELMNMLLADTAKLFPAPRRLKAPFRKCIDDAVFHGGTLRLDTSAMRRQFVIDHGEQKFPFMTWTAGQREFIPLLLGLYHLLTAGKVTKRPDIEWVVIEEPEMGLHPKAIIAVMSLVLELLHRGYKVAISTHSPVVLDIVWALKHLRSNPNGNLHLCDIFDMRRTQDVLETMTSALTKEYTVVNLRQGRDEMVECVDISELSPASTHDAEAGWGGLTGFSGHVADIVAKAASARRAS